MTIQIMTKFTQARNYNLLISEDTRKECEDCGEMKLTTELRATLWWKCEECWDAYLDRHISEYI